MELSSNKFEPLSLHYEDFPLESNRVLLSEGIPDDNRTIGNPEILPKWGGPTFKMWSILLKESWFSNIPPNMLLVWALLTI